MTSPSDLSNFGPLFKQIRQDRRLTINAVRGTLSPGTVSRFESGAGDITLTTFLELLANLNMDLDEFCRLLGQASPAHQSQNPHRRFCHQLYHAASQTTDAEARALKQACDQRFATTHEPTDHLRACMAQAAIFDVNNATQTLSQRDSDLIEDYLTHVEVWYAFEFDLYIDTIIFVAPTTFARLRQKMITGYFASQDTPSTHYPFCQALFNTAIAHLNAHDYQAAQRLLRTINSAELPGNVFYFTAQLHLVQLFITAQLEPTPATQAAADAFLTAMDAISPAFAAKERRWLESIGLRVAAQ